MPRNANHQADGDTRFMGMAPRLDPATLPEGMVSEARNMRFRHGVAETRKGVYKPPWANNITPEIDAKVRAFGEVHGVGVFKNPSNLEFVIIAADNKVYYTRQNNNPIVLAMPGKPTPTDLDGDINSSVTTITVGRVTGFPPFGVIIIGNEQIYYTAISANDFTGCTRGYNSTTAAAHTSGDTVESEDRGVKVTGTVNFVQAFNKIVMYRGVNFAPLVMSSEDTGFEDMMTQWSSTGAYAVDDEVAFGPLVSVASIAHSGGIATVTCSAEHGYATGADVTIAGANESEFNGRVDVTVTSKSAFTYLINTSNSSATGTITCTNNRDYYKCTVITTAGQSPVTTSSSWSQLSTIMPNSTHGIFVANRLAAPTRYDSTATSYGNKRDFIAVSDTLDLAHTYFNQIFRVNYGSDDEVVDLLQYDENRVLVFKTKSVHMVTSFIVEGTNATFGTSVSIQPVITNYGVSGRGACVVVGSDVYFYASRRGVVSIAQTEQSKVRGVDIPLSEAIQPLIDRIDSRHEDKIRMAYWDNKLWVACPIDDGTSGNNALLVYDYLNQAWASYDKGDAIKPKEFFIATYNNAQRLFFVGTDGFINLLEENWAGDDEADLTQDDGLKTDDFESYLLTRGYHSNDTDHRDFREASVGLSTWNPKYTIKTKTDGVNEEQTLVSERTKSRTAYYRPFNAAAWERNNFNDDFATPYRQDYSVGIDETRGVLLTEDGDTLAMEGVGGVLNEDGLGGFNLGSNGVDFSKMQETMEPFPLTPRKGRYTQLEISNTQGKIKLNQAVITNQSGDRTLTVKS